MNLDNERKVFDKWVLTHPDNLDLTAYEENIMFDAWLASANREGYKLVPVDPSKACLDNLGNVIFDNFGTTTTEVDRCAEKAYKAMIGACDECNHSSDGLLYTSNPPLLKCEKCGEFFKN